ASGRPLA
nr:VP2b protein [Blotched snakehead virus]